MRSRRYTANTFRNFIAPRGRFPASESWVEMAGIGRLQTCMNGSVWAVAHADPALKSQGQMKELIEVTTAVIRKRLTVYEPAFAIESQRWLESGATPRFQAEPAQTASLRFANDVIEECSGNTFAEMLRIGSHRFQLAGPVPEFL
jgi:hypothetical protein